MKAIQMFTEEYLEQCQKMSPSEILEFLENFRLLHGGKTAQNGSSTSGPSKLISIKIPKPLLEAFKAKARLSDIPYQTQIKRLMEQWIK
jgi:predicted DNA binding CopG/RHH family protein